jgi:hypothetical protein
MEKEKAKHVADLEAVLATVDHDVAHHLAAEAEAMAEAKKEMECSNSESDRKKTEEADAIKTEQAGEATTTVAPGEKPITEAVEEVKTEETA